MAHGATVLVGTPGRLADVVARTRGNTAVLDLRRLEVLPPVLVAALTSKIHVWNAARCKLLDRHSAPCQSHCPATTLCAFTASYLDLVRCARLVPLVTDRRNRLESVSPWLTEPIGV